MKLSPRPVLTFLTLSSLIFANIASGQEGKGAKFLEDILHRIANFLATILVVVSIIFIIIAAYNFLTSGGSEDKVASARNSILYAVVAIIIAAIAFFVPDIILDVLGLRTESGTFYFQQ